MRKKTKNIIVAVIIAWVALGAIVRWYRGTPEEQLVRHYQARFDDAKAQIDRALAALPASAEEPVLDEARLSELQDVRIVLADEAALKNAEEVFRSRVDDVFAARLQFWQPDRLRTEAPHEFTGSMRAWPIYGPPDELARAYDEFLDNLPDYMVVLRPVKWIAPDASKRPIVGGYAEIELYLIDVKNARTLASTRFDHAQEGMIHHSGDAQRQAEYDFRSFVRFMAWRWIDSRFSREQRFKIESMVYGRDGLEEPDEPDRGWRDHPERGEWGARP